MTKRTIDAVEDFRIKLSSFNILSEACRQMSDEEILSLLVKAGDSISKSRTLTGNLMFSRLAKSTRKSDFENEHKNIDTIYEEVKILSMHEKKYIDIKTEQTQENLDGLRRNIFVIFLRNTVYNDINLETYSRKILRYKNIFFPENITNKTQADIRRLYQLAKKRSAQIDKIKKSIEGGKIKRSYLTEKLIDLQFKE